MMYQCFCVRDNAIGAFLPPFFTRSRGEALRSFSEAVNDEKHQFHRHAADYTLYAIGAWDDTNGLLSPLEPARIASATEVLVEDPVFPPSARVRDSNGAVKYE